MLTKSALLTLFKREFATTLKVMRAFPQDKPVEFAGHQFPAGEFMLTMLCDQIHHCGQLSVYVRMAGGKVPSIYGPSADEPEGRL